MYSGLIMLGLGKPNETFSKVRTLHFTSHTKLLSLVIATAATPPACA